MIVLKDTINAMISDDYKERFVAEYQQLIIRCKSLKAMLEKWDKSELDFTPTCPYGIYKIQIEAMEHYIDILETRAVIEDIDLQVINFG